MTNQAFIYDAIRTPRGRGKATGSLHGVKPVTLVADLLEELQTRNPTLDANVIDDVILGCVSPVGDQGGDIARTAAMVAGYPDTVGGIQINRFCASALEAVNSPFSELYSRFLYSPASSAVKVVPLLEE